MTRLLTTAALLLAACAGPLAAQRGLGETLDRVAGLWARGDAAALTALTASSGLDLEINGASMGPLTGRKAAAALRRVFDDRVTVSVMFSMTSAVTGAENRAFGELTWEVRSGGATLPERSTVFLALVREPAGWRLTQIRILE